MLGQALRWQTAVTTVCRRHRWVQLLRQLLVMTGRASETRQGPQAFSTKHGWKRELGVCEKGVHCLLYTGTLALSRRDHSKWKLSAAVCGHASGSKDLRRDLTTVSSAECFRNFRQFERARRFSSAAVEEILSRMEAGSGQSWRMHAWEQGCIATTITKTCVVRCAGNLQHWVSARQETLPIHSNTEKESQKESIKRHAEGK